MAYFKENLFLKLSCFFKMPIASYVSPKIVEITDDTCVVKVKLKRRTRNFNGSMFLGGLTTGADVVVGVPIFLEMTRIRKKITFAIKQMDCSFLKSAKSDVYFHLNHPQELRNFVHELLDKPDIRIEKTVEVIARCPDTRGDEPVARFSVTVSGKK